LLSSWNVPSRRAPDRKAIPYRSTLSHVNNFIINTTQFLNRFSYLCEEKLRKVSRDVQRLDIMLRILEEKASRFSCAVVSAF
jgi:hypothetical protein